MAQRARSLFLLALLLGFFQQVCAADARFDLIGPKIDVEVTRNGVTLPIASVPNLQPGDKLWIHPDLPPTQSVHYLLICVFLRGNTNPPPVEWFTRIETWNHKVRQEGTFVTVPAEAQQAVLFLAPETGGDFSTLRSAVQGRPGVFVRASQDLTEAGFEQARIEKYLANIRRVPPSDPAELQKRSTLLARTLALKPNTDCFKQPVDTQFTCLTQTGSQVVLDDGHGQTLVNALSSGPNSDFINQASTTRLAAGGNYSAYVGAIVDMFRILGSIHTALYQYIPAISFPEGQSMNLRLNTPPSFHNPKSVLVIALPAVLPATPPPLRPADANHVACLIEPVVTLPIEGAPLVFSTSFAHDLVLHLNTPAGAPTEPDIPLMPDAYDGGLVLQQPQTHHVPLRDPLPLNEAVVDVTKRIKPLAASGTAAPTAPEPVLLTGTIQGSWGFDAFTGPTVPLQQLPGTDWQIVPAPGSSGNELGNNPGGHLIAGHNAQLLLTSTGTSCVHTITAQPTGSKQTLSIEFKPADKPNQLALTLPLEHELTPGDLHLAIQQFDQPAPDELSTRTFAEPPTVSAVELHAGDKSLLLTGSHLAQVDHLTLGDLTFTPTTNATNSDTSLRLGLPADAPAPATHIDEHLTAQLTLHDGRTLPVPVTVSAARPAITLLRKAETPAPNSTITLANTDDLPLSSTLTFTLKSRNPFPRNGEIDIETLDGTLRSVLTLAPAGGLVLQDPHTIVATLDPLLHSFGPSAFGALHFRAIYPPTKTFDTAVGPATAPADNSDLPASDWLPLVNLVRLPVFKLLQCPADTSQSCTLTGSNLFLLDSLSTSPSFANPVPVPDGYTANSITIPHPTAATLFLKLRDDPSTIDTAVLPVPPPPPPRKAPKPAPEETPTPTAPLPPASTSPATPAPQQKSPVPAAPAPSAVPAHGK
jgi:hypothetical protein